MDQSEKNINKQNTNQNDDIVIDLQNKLEISEKNYFRALADYQNLQRRTEDERRSIILYSNAKLIKEMLGILDDLYACLAHINDQGLKSIVNKFEKILKDEGLTEIETAGKDFNPEIHEAIESVDGEDNKIVKTHRKGYMLNDKLIRPALVAVGRNS